MSRRVAFVFVWVAACAAPPRFAVVNRDEWASVQSLPSQREVNRLTASFARQHGLNLVFEDDQLFYAAPDLDVTMVLLGKEAHPVRAGERLGRFSLRAVFDRSHDGVAEHARLQKELDLKQGELDRMQRAVIAQLGIQGTPTLEQRQQVTQALQHGPLRHRFDELSEELQRHTKEANLALIARLKPDLEALAKQHQLDAVFEATDDGRRLVYRRRATFPVAGYDLTEELIRLHDQRVP